MSRPILALALLLVAGALTAAVLLMRPAPVPAIEAGTVLARPQPVPAFDLVDQHGQTFDQRALRGNWSLLFTGFTSCPDICPTTLIELDTLDRRLRAGGGELRMIFLSVDPARDTPEVMSRYIAHFSPNVVGVTGNEPEIRRLCDSLGLSYVHVPGVGDRYTVDHAGSLLLIDPRGRVSAYFKPPFDLDRLAADLGTIIDA